MPADAPATQVFTDRCACGHDRSHKMVRTESRYGLFGLLGVAFFGVSARPKQVEVVCPYCRTVFERSTDPKTLKEHAYK